MPQQALVVLDMQTWIIDRYADPSPWLSAVGRALDVARTRGIPVIYSRVVFRPGAPEIDPRNHRFAALKRAGGIYEGEPGTEVHVEVAPSQHDVVVTKKRVSAFAGSDLELILRASGVEDLVVCGTSSSGAVLSTIRQAADLDFRLTVLRDACGDQDRAVHDLLMDKVFPVQASVSTVDEWEAALAGES